MTDPLGTKIDHIYKGTKFVQKTAILADVDYSMLMKDIMNDIFSAGGAEVSIIPVMQGEGMMKLDENQLPDSLPILALRNAVLFPGTVYPITIGREKSIRLIEDAEKSNTFIGAVPQNDLAVEDPSSRIFTVMVLSQRSSRLLRCRTEPSLLSFVVTRDSR